MIRGLLLSCLGPGGLVAQLEREKKAKRRERWLTQDVLVFFSLAFWGSSHAPSLVKTAQNEGTPSRINTEQPAPRSLAKKSKSPVEYRENKIIL